MSELKSFIGTKTLKACPMTLGNFLLRGDKIPTEEEMRKSGYMVQYSDDYISWSPKDVFEEAYRCIEGLAPIQYGAVFPSEDSTVSVVPDSDYNGAHRYVFMNSLGFSEGKAQYVDSTQFIQFVQKNEDGTIIPGVQSEQLVLALLDRTEKLNNRYPSEYNQRMMDALEDFLGACADRIKDRIDRGVMGELKK